MESRGCWFLFQYLFSEFLNQNPFLGKFGLKKSKLSILPENWHTDYLEGADSYCDINFLIFQPRIHFWVNLGWKSQSSLFWLKIGTHTRTHTHTHTHTHAHAERERQRDRERQRETERQRERISRILILISTLVFSNFKPKSLGYWFLFWD